MPEWLAKYIVNGSVAPFKIFQLIVNKHPTETTEQHLDRLLEVLLWDGYVSHSHLREEEKFNG